MTFVLRPASNVAAPRGKAVTVGQWVGRKSGAAAMGQKEEICTCRMR